MLCSSVAVVLTHKQLSRLRAIVVLMALHALHMHALEQCIVVLCLVCITECSVAVHFNPMVLVRA
jgi:hypothetical protein